MNEEVKRVLKKLFIERFSKFILLLFFLVLFVAISHLNITETWQWLKLINMSILALSLVWLMDRLLYNER